MKIKKIKRYVKIATTLLVTLSLFACSKETPLSPNTQNKPGVMTKPTDQITFLKSKTPGLNKIFGKSELITVAEGGLLRVGNEDTGISGICFMAGDVQTDVLVHMYWDSQNFQAEFTPHGITFMDSVLIRLSYRDAELGNVNEEDLRIWYYDENNNLWELAGREVNTDEKYIQGYTTHFSRYAIGAE